MLLSTLAQKLQFNFDGEDLDISAINTLNHANKHEITFFDNQKYQDQLLTTKAAAIFIAKEFVEHLPKDVIALVSDEPYLKMAQASYYFKKPLIREKKEPTIASSALIQERVHIGNGVTIGEGVTILSGAVIGEDVNIGDNCTIYPNVTIYNDTQIGQNCTIHAGSVIGSDGFGYAHTKLGEHVKIYHNGKVIIEDDVEIGANTTIDRAVFGATIIKKGTKIDNLVQIGHNCEVGEYSILVSQVGLAGSTTLGRNVVLGGQSATAGHLKIADFVTIAARGGVTKSITKKDIYSGFPLMRHKDWLKLQAKISKLLNK